MFPVHYCGAELSKLDLPTMSYYAYFVNCLEFRALFFLLFVN
jgi:hypothetical protein